MGCASEGVKRPERGLTFPKFMFTEQNVGGVNTVEREFAFQNGEGCIETCHIDRDWVFFQFSVPVLKRLVHTSL